jgi:hypothetical protein
MGGLYAGEGWFEIFFVTGVLGGLAAWATGRAIAETWRAFHQLVGYMVLLGAAVVFGRYALFAGSRQFLVPRHTGAPHGHPISLAL